MGVNYEDTFFKSKSLLKAAKVYLKYLPTDVKILLCSGSSGCSIASAMTALALVGPKITRRNLAVIYLRKDKENAHGGAAAGPCTELPGRNIAIVDDFIVTGDTIQRLWNYINREDAILRCVIVGHKGDSSIVRELEESQIEIIELDKYIK